ncbi:MAG: FAD-dependent oxidoreductase [Thermomicrobiales bacterium]|nr:FAD-dependent oxidoreductase [Thermomicrobiales bacterium]
MDVSIDVDVAILGAGYSGLWTAYYLLQQNPSLKVAILEREIAGFGASGRNGAWCTSGFPTSMDTLAKGWGRSAAIDMHRAMAGAVDEVGSFAARHALDIQWEKSGSLFIARGEAQLPEIGEIARSLTDYGFEDEVEVYDKAATDERIRITETLGSVWLKQTAVIHPGRLVRGLARVVESMGATIYEQTAVTDFTGGAYPVLHTDRGHARARMVVLCGEAYMSGLKGVGRQVMPVYSLITLTEPLTSDQWAAIGWYSRHTVESCKYTIDYLSKTADGRILFGGRGAPYHFGSKIEDSYDLHGPTHTMLQDNVRAWFPGLKDVRFTHTWGGPLGWPRDFMPTFSFDVRTNVASARGYTGNGVATANLAGRTLADLMLGRQTERTTLPPVNHRSRSWEPEPFRFLGVRYVQRSFGKLDEKAARTGKAPDGKSLAERLAKR